jgi:hypothetical protein
MASNFNFETFYFIDLNTLTTDDNLNYLFRLPCPINVDLNEFCYAQMLSCSAPSAVCNTDDCMITIHKMDTAEELQLKLPITAAKNISDFIGLFNAKLNTAHVKIFCNTDGPPFSFRWLKESGRVSIEKDAHLDQDNITLELNSCVANKLTFNVGVVREIPCYSHGLININLNNEYLVICMDSVESSIGLCGGKLLPIIAVFPLKFDIRNTAQYEYIYSASVQKRNYEMVHPTRHRIARTHLDCLRFRIIHENGANVIFDGFSGSIIFQIKLFKLFHI